LQIYADLAILIPTKAMGQTTMQKKYWNRSRSDKT